MRGSRLHGNDGGLTSPSPNTLILAFSPQGRRDLSPRGSDGGSSFDDADEAAAAHADHGAVGDTRSLSC